MPEETNDKREWSVAPTGGAALCTDHDTAAKLLCVPERYAAGEDFQIARSPLFFPIAKKICHVCAKAKSSVRIKRFKKDVNIRKWCSQSFES